MSNYLVIGVFVALCVLALVLMALSVRRRASSFERRLAFAWLVIRRICSAMFVLLCFVGVVMALATLKAPNGRSFTPGGLIFWVLLLAVLGGFVARFGLFGSGIERDPGDDEPVHEDRKRRYDWN